MTQPHPWDAGAPDRVHIWNTLGYRFGEGRGDRITIEWDAGPEYAFPNGGRTIVHGGMVTTLLDTAMGHALHAEAEVRHQSRRAMFCEASLYDAESVLLASARCTQIVRSAA